MARDSSSLFWADNHVSSTILHMGIGYVRNIPPVEYAKCARNFRRCATVGFSQSTFCRLETRSEATSGRERAPGLVQSVTGDLHGFSEGKPDQWSYKRLVLCECSVLETIDSHNFLISFIVSSLSFYKCWDVLWRAIPRWLWLCNCAVV